jgi:hypothetical protein
MGLILPILYPHDFDASIMGKEVVVDTQGGYFSIEGRPYQMPDFGPVAKIIAAGGLTNYTKQRIMIEAK